MTTKPQSYVAYVMPKGDGWSILCSCGYLVTGWPTQALAQADLDNHIARAHEKRDAA